ncbi:MAG: putative Ig domain-containing protein [Caldilineaceae bacterium]
MRQTATVTVVIRNVNEPPVVVHPVPSQQVLVNDAAGFAMTSNTFADPDLNDVLSYSATLVDGSPLPAWLAFDPTTGLFGGTPSTAQTLTIRITATDLGGLQASTDFVLTVTGIPTSLEESDEPVFKAQIFLPNYGTVIKKCVLRIACYRFGHLLRSISELVHVIRNTQQGMAVLRVLVWALASKRLSEPVHVTRNTQHVLKKQIDPPHPLPSAHTPFPKISIMPSAYSVIILG